MLILVPAGLCLGISSFVGYRPEGEPVGSTWLLWRSTRFHVDPSGVSEDTAWRVVVVPLTEYELPLEDPQKIVARVDEIERIEGTGSEPITEGDWVALSLSTEDFRSLRSRVPVSGTLRPIIDYPSWGLKLELEGRS